MGVWTLGRDAALQPRAATPPMAAEVSAAAPSAVSEGKEKLADFAGRLLTWIPSDMLVIYAGLLTAFATTDIDTAVWVTVGCAIAAPFIVILSAFSNSADATWRAKKTLFRAVLSFFAFALWSVTVPASGWNKIEWLAEDPGRKAALAGAAGFVLNLIASGIDKRISPN